MKNSVVELLDGTVVPCIVIGNKKVVNLMKHPATLKTPQGDYITLPASGIEAKVTTETVAGKGLGEFPTTKTVLGEVVGLPSGVRGVLFYVNMVVFNTCLHHMNGRYDLVMGDSSGSEERWTAESLIEIFGADGAEKKKFLVGLMRAVTTLKLAGEQ